MIGTNKSAVATDDGDLAHLGHGGQTTGQLADNFFLMAAQLVTLTTGAPKSTPSADMWERKHIRVQG